MIDLQQKAVQEFEPTKNVPTPENWGGYLVVPEEIEFWQGNDIRLHDRIRFRKLNGNEKLTEMAVEGENGWIIERLAP